jgi:glycolate oxidase FAD binding subunit
VNPWREHLERELGSANVVNISPGLGLTECAPDSVEGVRAALAIAREHNLVVVPCGLGSKASWCPPVRADLALSTRRLCGVVSYEPGDGTVAARAGTPMAALAATVRAGGHHLTPDVPRPQGATLGGVIAAGQSGFDRLRHGPVRNALLGTRVVLSDGRIAKSGGQLVKNVTGYDLHRLYCGSHGTLCVIVEAALRLHPLPAARRVLVRAAPDLAQALALARAALAVPARHLAVWAHDRGDEPRAFVALAGRAEVVEHEAALVRAAWKDARDTREVDGDAAEALCIAEREREDPARATAELATKRSDLAPALDALLAAARTSGFAPRASVHPGVARASVEFDDASAAELAMLAASFQAPRGTLAWRGVPGLEQAHGPAPPPPALALMRALQDALDPLALFARGRLAAGRGEKL